MRWAAEETDAMEEMILDNTPIAKVAKSLRRTYSSVAQKLNSMGLSCPSRMIARWEEILSLPLSRKTVARRMNCTLAGVQQAKTRLRKAGFKVPRQKPGRKK